MTDEKSTAESVTERAAAGHVDCPSVEERVRRIVVEALELDVPARDLPLEEPLFGGDTGADSIASLEIVFGLEREFGIQVSDEELRAELFDSVASLCAYVEEKLGTSAREPAGEPAQD